MPGLEFNLPTNDRPAVVGECAKIMFADPLFAGKTTDYDILNDYYDEYGWSIILMPNHEPERLYFFNNLGLGEPVSMWTYTKTATQLFENFPKN